ncbi:MAG: 3-deoxy-D-manno-octulosonic acid transferase [Lautropia sp.]|nr:3-deoxy-D-manno-octulosonic acid transferase [Lautropia sp.]
MITRQPATPSTARNLYSWGWRLGMPAILGYLLYRSIAQPEYRQHWGERFGHWPVPSSTPDIFSYHHGQVRPLWIHAVSVGETAAVLPLLRQFAAAWPEVPILLTHGTPTGRAAGALRLQDLGGRLAQSYLPYDTPEAINRFFDHWKPAVGLIVETEVWPNLVAVANERGIPLAAVNARLSAKSLQRGMRFRSLIEPAVKGYSMIIAQTQDDAERIARLGRRPEFVVGNLKFDQPADFMMQARGRGWRNRFGERLVVLAASTREGEEALILESWKQTLKHRHGEFRLRDEQGAVLGDGLPPLLILVPRHPNRFDAVARLVKRYMGQAPLFRASLDDERTNFSEACVLLGDSMGEMQAWYASADVTVMGGSLLPFGSQNLIEANAAGCPVVLGPSVYNFQQAAEASILFSASIQVQNPRDAIPAALGLAADPGRRGAMSEAGVAFAQAHRGALERTMEALGPLLVETLGRPAVPLPVSA